MSAVRQSRIHEYDAFISYSRQDNEFATKLQRVLERFTLPRGLGKSTRRLSIFRDESDLTGTEYYEAIDKFLDASLKMIVICSPVARASEYVNDEVERWIERKGPQGIVPVLVAGQPNNETANEASWAFPDVLVSTLAMPLAIDYRNLDLHRDNIKRGSFQNAWYTLIGNLLDKSRSEVEDRDRKQIRRRRMLVGATTFTIMAALASLAVVALLQRNEARLQRNEALARGLAARSELLLDQKGALLETAALLSVEAMKRAPSLDTDLAIRKVLALLPSRIAEIECAVGGDVKVTAYSPDGHYLAVQSGDEVVRIWETITGQRISEFTVPDLQELVFHPKARQLVTMGRRGTKIWDFTELPALTLFNQADISALAFSPDGGYLTTVSGSKTRIWDAETYETVAEFDNSMKPLFVAVSYDAAEVVAWSNERAEFFSSPGPPRQVFNLGATTAWWKYSPSGRYLVQVEPLNYTIGLFDTETREHLIFEQRHWHATFSGDGKVFAVASPEWDAYTYQLESCHGAGTYTKIGAKGLTSGVSPGRVSCRKNEKVHHDNSVVEVALNHDGSLLGTTSRDGTARVWESYRGREVLRILEKVAGEIHSIAFPKGTDLVSTLGPQRCQTWKARGHREAISMRHDDAVLAMDFSADGGLMATVAMRGAFASRFAWVWSLPEGRKVMSVELPGGSGESISLNPEATHVLVDNRVLINIETQQEEEVDFWFAELQKVVISTDWKTVAYMGDDGGVIVGDFKSGDQRSRHPPIDSEIASLVLSPDGSRVALVEESGSIHLWRWESSESDVLVSPASVPEVVRFDQTGLRLLTIEEDEAHKVVLWDAKTGKRLAEMPGEARVIDARFHPDRDYLSTGSEDGNARVWDIKTRTVIAQFAHDADVVVVGFSPDGKYMMSGGGRSDRHARLWYWNPEDLIEEVCARISRNLTMEEWMQHIGSEEYEATCSKESTLNHIDRSTVGLR